MELEVFKQVLDDFVEASKFWIKSGNTVPCTATLFNDRKPKPIATFLPIQDKDFVAKVLQHLARTRAMDGYIIISESWAISGMKDIDLEVWYREHSSLEDHPNKVEVITGYASCPEGEVMRIWRIIRNNDEIEFEDMTAGEEFERFGHNRFGVNWKETLDAVAHKQDEESEESKYAVEDKEEEEP